MDTICFKVRAGSKVKINFENTIICVSSLFKSNAEISWMKQGILIQCCFPWQGISKDISRHLLRIVGLFPKLTKIKKFLNSSLSFQIFGHCLSLGSSGSKAGIGVSLFVR